MHWASLTLALAAQKCPNSSLYRYFTRYTSFWTLYSMGFTIPSDSPLRLIDVILSPNGRWRVKGGSQGGIWERRKIISKANTQILQIWIQQKTTQVTKILDWILDVTQGFRPSWNMKDFHGEKAFQELPTKSVLKSKLTFDQQSRV